MSIIWQNLRDWGGSKHTGFEELCCQLAACEVVPKGAAFIRKGAPDAGVECYWSLPQGEEWAWQAKFFTNSLGDNQWRQIDESVRTALDKHPKLVRYIVCIPLDRQDPRITDDQGKQERWFMDKWNERVKRWEGWAAAKGMAVTFDYWGEHEIFLRLSQEEHRGRNLFWFNEELFSSLWFEHQLDQAIANAGERYTPELNVELPIARLFDGLGRTNEFFTRLKSLFGQVRREFVDARPPNTDDQMIAEFDALEKPMSELLRLLADVRPQSLAFIDFNAVSRFAEESVNGTFAYRAALEKKAVERKDAADEKEAERDRNRDIWNFRRHSVYTLRHKLEELIEFANSSEATLSNVPALLLLGEAGTGKTHLFCDVARQRLVHDLPSVLLLGQHFANSDPWPQILGLLGLNCTREEFLGALDAAGQARGAKTILIIDALNEGEGRKIWKHHISGLLELVRKYKWVGISLSVRTSYEDTVIPSYLDLSRMVRETHHGFAHHEYEATKTFFDAHGILRPAIPLLNPEFQNPLFLKLFCKGLKNRGLTEVPKGLHGITTVFDFLTNSVNEKLSAEEVLSFDPKQPIVRRALNKVAEAMADRQKAWLLREEAIEIVNAVLPTSEGFHNSLFRHLVSEGLLAEDRVYVGDDTYEEAIRLTYERFADHLIVDNLMDRYIDESNPSASFLPGTPLGALVEDEFACHRNRGLLEALAIQLPEKIGKELPEVAPNAADYMPVRFSFVKSLVWRKTSAFSDGALEVVSKILFHLSE